MASLIFFAAAASAFLAVSDAVAVSGRIVYVAFDADTTLKSIDLASKNKVSEVLKFPPYQYPTWSESSATNGANTFFYNFIADDDVTGITVGVDVSTKKILFSHKTDYFWRVAYDPADPDFVYGLSIPGNNILLEKINVTSGKNETVGMLPDGLTSPQNSAVFDPATHTFYAYLANEEGTTSVYGIDAVSGALVSNSSVNSSLYICEAVKDESSGKFYGVVMDANSNAWLAHLDPVSGAASPVGSAVMGVSSCDAGSALSSKQRLYFAYIKDNDGNSQITAWNLDTGALVEHFVVENAVFGMQLFE